MRSFSVLAVLSAVLSAAGASACWWKCGSAAAPSPAPPEGVAAPAAGGIPPTYPFGPYLEIDSVDGQAPDQSTTPWSIPNPVPAGTIDISVDVDLNTGQNYYVYLFVEDLSNPLSPAEKAAKKPPKKYTRKAKYEVKTINVRPNPPKDGAKEAAVNTLLKVFVFHYGVDTVSGHKYQAYAQAQTEDGTPVVTSHTVVFTAQ